MTGRAETARRKRVKYARASQLFLAIGETFYGVRALPVAASEATRAFRLNKFDGTVYDVAETCRGPQCDCPDFIFRRDGIDPGGCKHVRALVRQGLIAGAVS